MRYILLGSLCWLLAVTGSLRAEGQDKGKDSPEQAIIKKMQVAVPQLPIAGVKISPLKGLYEVELANGERVFATADGNHFIAGDLFRVAEEGLVNLTELDRDTGRAEKMAAIKDEQMIVFSPANKKASIAVFTDVDCGYCRKLHKQMDGYLAHGIEVKYLAFPRAGIGSGSYKKIVSAWCADDQQQALTSLKMGDNIEQKECENPVAEHYRLGNQIGVTGTPALVLESGKLVPGYIEPDRLAQLLGI